MEKLQRLIMWRTCVANYWSIRITILNTVLTHTISICSFFWYYLGFLLRIAISQKIHSYQESDQSRIRILMSWIFWTSSEYRMSMPRSRNYSSRLPPPFWAWKLLKSSDATTTIKRWYYVENMEYSHFNTFQSKNNDNQWKKLMLTLILSFDSIIQT